LPAAAPSASKRSRGAARVVMIEQAPKVLAALHENHELLHKPSGVEIVRADAIQYLASTQAKFDLIFLDPPYKKGWIPAWSHSFPAC
jgi:16S rRNA (guanine966-N2)-methyltransferase